MTQEVDDTRNWGHNSFEALEVGTKDVDDASGWITRGWGHEVGNTRVWGRMKLGTQGVGNT